MPNEVVRILRELARSGLVLAREISDSVGGAYRGQGGGLLAAAGTTGSLDSVLPAGLGAVERESLSGQRFFASKRNYGNKNTCLECGNAAESCTCSDHPFIGTDKGCPNCGRTISDCAASPCSAFRDL